MSLTASQSFLLIYILYYIFMKKSMRIIGE
nr:MAG TPA: hypothetical protein [Caudoviricetes sp.]